MSEYEGQVWVLTYGWKKSNASAGRRELFVAEGAVKRHIDDLLAAQRTGEHEVRDFKVWSWDGKSWGEHELTPGWSGVEIGGARRTFKVSWAESALADARADLQTWLDLHSGHVISDQTVRVARDCLTVALGDED